MDWMRPINSSVCVICCRSARTTPTAGGPGAGWAPAETGNTITMRSRSTCTGGLYFIVFSKAPYAKLPQLNLRSYRSSGEEGVSKEPNKYAPEGESTGAGSRSYGRLTVSIELGCGIDFCRCHLARNIAHLLADVIASGAGRKSL